MAETISLTLNGSPKKLTAEIESSALEAIRDQTGMTGTKLVCGSGACGACTILVDGRAQCACLTPAVQLEGKNVQTVEAHAQDALHPVQKAFLAHDGLQCGYCTPGFINEGIAFYDHWRKRHGKQRPDREEVAEAMAGHLCRCGAYIGIYAAIAAACAGDFDGPGMPEYQRVDGIDKVTGKAVYTTDVKLPGQLIGAIYRSPFPHARVSNIDLSAARSMPGVKAAIVLKKDATLRYEGEPIAAVAAETHAQAQAAIAAIRADFEALEFVTDGVASRRNKEINLVPEDKKEIPVASEGPAFPGSWDHNVRQTKFSLTSSKKGKAKRKVRDMQTGINSFAATFLTPTQFHTTLEPHCAVADWKENGKLTVYTSTQAVYFLAKDIAKHYDLKEENVEVIAEHVGGAFGSKLTLRTEALTAIDLSREAGAPVEVIYSRAEELLETGFRPPAEIEIKITSDSDGQNPAFRMDAYGSSGLAIGSNIADIAGLNYTGIAKSLQDYDVLTNFSPGCAFRAPGGPAAAFALEQAIDQLAHQLELAPIAFRRVWEEHEGYKALFDWVEGQALWKGRGASGRQQGRFRKGVGVAFGAWFHFYMPSAEVEVSAGPDGLSVSNAVQDMGQGAKSVLARAVADVFGVAPTTVRVIAGRSQLTTGPTSGGSRTAASIYPAAYEAAVALRDRLVTAIVKKQSLSDAQAETGGIRHSGGRMRWNEIFSEIGTVTERAKRGRNKGFTALGALPLAQGLRFGQHRSYGVYVIEVEVDTLLGKVRCTQVRGALRAGRIFVKSGARSQAYGGVIQGIGHALYEDRALCPTTGRILSRGLEDYRVPGIGDTPEIQVDFIEEGFEKAKQQGIGIAELCTVPVAGAIANAVYNATGWRPLKAPILPEDVLAGLAGI